MTPALARSIAKAEQVAERIAPKAKRRITRLTLSEVSVVDRPAVPLPGSSGNVILTKHGGQIAITTFRIVKASNEPEQRYALFAALIPELVDQQGDVIDAPTIRAAASDFMAKRQIGLQHGKMLDGADAKLVDSFVAPEDLTIGSTPVAKGTWLVGLILSPDLFASVKSGKLLGVSIGGHAAGEAVR